MVKLKLSSAFLDGMPRGTVVGCIRCAVCAWSSIGTEVGVPCDVGKGTRPRRAQGFSSRMCIHYWKGRVSEVGCPLLFLASAPIEGVSFSGRRVFFFRDGQSGFQLLADRRHGSRSIGGSLAGSHRVWIGCSTRFWLQHFFC